MYTIYSFEISKSQDVQLLRLIIPRTLRLPGGGASPGGSWPDTKSDKAAISCMAANTIEILSFREIGNKFSVYKQIGYEQKKT